MEPVGDRGFQYRLVRGFPTLDHQVWLEKVLREAKRMRLRGLLWALLGIIVSASSTAAKSHYFPPRQGLSSTYGGSPMEIARTVEVQPRSGSYIWNGPLGTRDVRIDEAGRLLEVTEDGERLLIDFEATEGSIWTVEGVDDDLVTGSSFEVADRSAAVGVSIGRFRDVLHLVVRPRDGLADAGLMDLWFAPDVGLVKWVELTIAGPQTYELTRLVYNDGTLANHNTVSHSLFDVTVSTAYCRGRSGGVPSRATTPSGSPRWTGKLPGQARSGSFWPDSDWATFKSDGRNWRFRCLFRLLTHGRT